MLSVLPQKKQATAVSAREKPQTNLMFVLLERYPQSTAPATDMNEHMDENAYSEI